MQTQKFDPKKDHGTVFNHPKAMFVQNNILYDAEGYPVEDEVQTSNNVRVKPKTEKKEPEQEALSIDKFLTDVLSKGPMAQNAIKKESDALGFAWVNVQITATDLGIEKYKGKGNVNMWKFKGSK